MNEISGLRRYDFRHLLEGRGDRHGQIEKEDVKKKWKGSGFQKGRGEGIHSRRRLNGGVDNRQRSRAHPARGPIIGRLSIFF